MTLQPMRPRRARLPGIARTFLAVIPASLLLGACGGFIFGGAPSGPVGGPPFRIWDSDRERYIDYRVFADEMADADLVVIGEQHDDPGTHGIELALLATLGERHENVVLSLEMFERDVQAPLDAYLDSRTTEAQFLENSRPWDRYTTDYRAMIELAKTRGWKVIASNVPRRIASAVSRGGLSALDTMSATERGYAARDIQCPRDNYYDRFAETMRDHVPGSNPSETAAAMQRYYEAQCIKDETMAESVVEALRNGAVVLHVTGAFHSDYREGTVQRALRRNSRASVMVLTAVPVPSPESARGEDHSERADFVFLVRRLNTPATGRN